MKNRILIAALALLLCGCNAEDNTASEETSLLSDNVTQAEITAAEITTSDTTTSVTASETSENVTETAEISEEQLRLEMLIDERAGGENAGEICLPVFGDFDGDGANELFAIYGSGNHGRLYFANDSGVSMIGEEGDWTAPKIVTAEGVPLIYTERLYDTESVSYYFQVRDGKPYRVETYGLMELRPAYEDGVFAAYHTTYDIYNDKVGGSLKPYWFYAVNNGGEIRFAEYYAALRYTEDIDGFIADVAEEFGCDIKQYIEETAERGEIDSFVKRSEIGIVDINYTVDGRRRYRSLKLRDGEVYEITPENNAGHYVAMVTANYALDYKMM